MNLTSYVVDEGYFPALRAVVKVTQPKVFYGPVPIGVTS